MPWCPICKNEYIEGKTHCPDCDVDLVPELPEESNIPESEPHLTSEELADIEARKLATAHMNTYISAKNRQTEAKSSAWTFLLVGSGGFVVITLALAGLIKLPLSMFSLAVMEIMFFIFLIIAGLSFRKAMNMLDDISKESTLEETILDWSKEHLTPDTLTVDLDTDTSHEMKYFMVTELMRERLMQAFPEIDDAYAEELTERFYNELFPEG